METNSMRISSQSRRYAKVQNLMHNVNEQNLMAQHRHQKLHKAPPVSIRWTNRGMKPMLMKILVNWYKK